MKKRFIFKVIVWIVLLMMITGGSGCMFSTAKANSTEQKIIGKWNGQVIVLSVDGDDSDYVPFDGWIELKKDLTGSFNLGDDVYTFTWSFKKRRDDTSYVYSVDTDEERLTLYYEEREEFLCLYPGGNVGVFYKR